MVSLYLLQYYGWFCAESVWCVYVGVYMSGVYMSVNVDLGVCVSIGKQWGCVCEYVCCLSLRA